MVVPGDFTSSELDVSNCNYTKTSAPLWNTFSKVTLNSILEAFTINLPKMPKFKN